MIALTNLELGGSPTWQKTAATYPCLLFSHAPPICGSSPSHLTEIAGPNCSPRDFRTLSMKDFWMAISWHVIWRCLRWSSRWGHGASQRGGHRHHLMSSFCRADLRNGQGMDVCREGFGRILCLSSVWFSDVFQQVSYYIQRFLPVILYRSFPRTHHHWHRSIWKKTRDLVNYSDNHIGDSYKQTLWILVICLFGFSKQHAFSKGTGSTALGRRLQQNRIAPRGENDHPAGRKKPDSSTTSVLQVRRYTVYLIPLLYLLLLSWCMGRQAYAKQFWPTFHRVLLLISGFSWQKIYPSTK